jgi:hypothetical protein
MSRVAAIALAGALLSACSSDATPEPPSSSGATSTSPSPTGPAVYEASGCPVADEEFCATAVQVIEALQAGDADQLFTLSRSDRLVCARVSTEYFPGCRTDDVLEGHGSAGADFIVEVLDEDGYREQLEALATNVDPSFSDELGDGAVRVLGVGTCGPDIPGRRTYHLAWTAAVSERGAPAERVLGSFELLFEDDWRIVLWYVSPLEEWEAEQPDPLELAFCEAGRSPWPA